MQLRFIYPIVSIIIGLLLFASCSVSPTNTDLLEYGYQGAVKSVKSTFYKDLVQRNDEWVIDESKIMQVRTVTFNEEGNIIKAVTTYPESPEIVETAYFKFNDGRKSAFVIVNAENDTLEKAVYNWISDTEYEYKSIFSTGRILQSWSKLSADFRDLSGGYTFKDGDSTLYAKSYQNTIEENNLISEINTTNDLSKEKSTQLLEYSDFDSMKNPQKVALIDKKTGLLDNFSVREFTYFK